VLAKLVYNVACSPNEDKFKTIQLSNKKIKESLVDGPGALEVMLLLGWEERDNALHCTKPLTMAQVRSRRVFYYS
jgi:hypothetical protein